MSLRSRSKSDPSSPYSPWDYSIYRLRQEERGHDLVGDIPDDEEALEWTRIAKWKEEIVGMYRLHRTSNEVFELASLEVAPLHRGRGLGCWLLSHAQAVVESSGGRCLEFRGKPCTTIFERQQFIPVSPDLLRFEIVPE